MRSTLRVSAFLVVLLGSAAAYADDFEKGKNAFIAKDYTEADARFRAMLDPNTGSLKSPELIDEARMFLGASLLALKRGDEADIVWAKILEHNDAYVPDPLTFSTPVLDAFTDTRTRHKDEINARKQREAQQAAANRAKEYEEKRRQAEYLKVLARLAGEEKIIDHHSRWVATVPFGVGQFQNGKPLIGSILLVTEGLLTLGTIVTGIIFYGQSAQANDALAGQTNNATNTALYDQYKARAATTRYVNLAIAAPLIVEMIAGVIEAHVNYVPNVELIQRRELPKAWLSPNFSTKPENGSFAGAGVEVGGRF